MPDHIKNNKNEPSARNDFQSCKAPLLSGESTFFPLPDHIKNDKLLGDLLRVIFKGRETYTGTLICITNHDFTIRTQTGIKCVTSSEDHSWDEIQVEKLPREYEKRKDWSSLCKQKNLIIYVEEFGCLTPDLIFGSAISFMQPNGIFITISAKDMQSGNFKACILTRNECEGMEWFGER